MRTVEYEELSVWKRVNSCETIEELQQCILSLADEQGMIQGRTRLFNAENMSSFSKMYYESNEDYITPSLITREYGLRQQVMYLKYYK